MYYRSRPADAGWSTLSYNRLSRFTLPNGTSQINRASEQVLINQFDQKTWHNGGDMYFGPDGFLYLVNGDEGADIPGGALSYSQKVDSGLFSGVLRIDVDRDPARSHPIRRQPVGSATPPNCWPATYSQNYYVPNDNPWIAPNGSVLEEFYAIGLRSPQRMSFEPVTGSALISDTGNGTMEEINVLAKGVNYQWACMEGTETGLVPGVHGPGTEAPPLHAYSERIVDGPAVIGGHVYRGAAHVADLGGDYVFGDSISGKVWALKWQQAGTPRRWLLTLPRGADFGGLSGPGCSRPRLQRDSLDLGSKLTSSGFSPAACRWMAAVAAAPARLPRKMESPICSSSRSGSLRRRSDTAAGSVTESSPSMALRISRSHSSSPIRLPTASDGNEREISRRFLAGIAVSPALIAALPNA